MDIFAACRSRAGIPLAACARLKNNTCYRARKRAAQRGAEGRGQKIGRKIRIQKILFPSTGTAGHGRGRGRRRVDLTEQMQRIGADLFHRRGGASASRKKRRRNQRGLIGFLELWTCAIGGYRGAGVARSAQFGSVNPGTSLIRVQSAASCFLESKNELSVAGSDTPRVSAPTRACTAVLHGHFFRSLPRGPSRQMFQFLFSADRANCRGISIGTGLRSCSYLLTCRKENLPGGL